MESSVAEKTYPSRWHAPHLALLIARVVLGVIFFAHGSQKLFGAFSGPGLDQWIAMIGPIGYLVALGEFIGGILLIIGFLSRWAALVIAIIMLGAMATVHGKHGFFLSNNGIEYALALLALALAILLMGPGRYAFVRLIGRSGSGWLE